MEKFIKLKAVAAVLDRSNVDTDLIIPKQFLKSIERTGFGRFVFNDLRFNPDGTDNPDFILNQPRYKNAQILVSRENFGCGSSREHAPWALTDYGFKVIISPTFADIFKSNSFKNGLLLIELPPTVIDELMGLILTNLGFELEVDLSAQTVTGGGGFSATFEIDPFRKELLLNGWDDISLTLKKENKITVYEEAHPNPWQAGVVTI
ncbi:MAG: 3-isopropylmalate dehydratase small subunit [Candidatus Adiutrix sp.]